MIVWDIIDESYRVAWGDLCYIKENLPETLLTGLVGPLLYLLAFGYGVGGSMGGGQDYIVFIVPGIIALTTLSATFSTVSMKILVQRLFYMSFDEMLLCPISKTAMILGKSILGIIKSMMCGLLMLAIGYFLADDLQITPALILCMILSCMVFSMLGVAAGMLVPDLPWMNLFNSFVILPMTFLCGTMFSLDALPDIAKDMISLLPLTHTSNCLRAAALGWDFPWVSLCILIVYGLFFYGLCMFSLRKTN